MSALLKIPSVEVVEGLKPEAIPDEVFESEVPLLLKGMVADWPAVAACRQSLDRAAKYLSSFWTDKPVTVYVGDGIDGRFGYNDTFDGFNFRSGKSHLGQVFEKLAVQQDAESPQAIYVGSTSVDRWLPGFRNKNDVLIPDQDALVSFWLGNNTRVSAHFDFPDNVACVVAGQRRFTLFPPDQIDNLYIGPIDRTPSGQAISLVDFADPDFERFPKFEQALETAVSYELQPGDAIFIPSMWWHHVESLSDFNLLVNYWWISSLPSMGSPISALLHAILAVRDLPERQRTAIRKLFDHYVFEADESVYAHIPESGRGCLAPLDEISARQLRADLLNRLNN
ncbi:MAG: cupin-like domain-containing protein [Woeseiaceae bacterium]|nr:cupin-like domain-containing protein [Woeseiaceae bacterium]